MTTNSILISIITGLIAGLIVFGLQQREKYKRCSSAFDDVFRISLEQEDEIKKLREQKHD